MINNDFDPEKVKKQLLAKYKGKNNLFVDSYPTLERFSTGILALDRALGGGMPVGRGVELFGDESAGKTTLALQILQEAQRQGIAGAFIDAERTLDDARIKSTGLTEREGYFYQYRPNSGEDALETVENFAMAGIGLIVVDSVAVLAPAASMEDDIEKVQVAVLARLMSKMQPRLVRAMDDYKCTILFINQLRSKIGVMYGDPNTTPGGSALRFMSSIRMRIGRVAKKEKDKSEEEGSIHTAITCVKNKTYKERQRCEIDLRPSFGVDPISSFCDALKSSDVGFIRQAGSYYDFIPEIAQELGVPERISQGAAGVTEFFRNNEPAYRRLYELALNKMLATIEDDDDPDNPSVVDSLDDL